MSSNIFYQNVANIALAGENSCLILNYVGFQLKVHPF